MMAVNRRKSVFYILAALTVLALSATVFSLGIYQGGWDNPATDIFLKVAPLPAAVVEGKVIFISEVNRMLSAFQKAVAYQAEFDFSSIAGGEALARQKEQILRALIENALIAGIADERGVEVAASELESYYQYLLPRFEINPQDSTAQIREIFGWRKQEFIRRIVRPDLLRAKISVKLLEEAPDPQAISRVEFIRNEIARGVDFGFLAGEFSDDEESRFAQGELGFFAKKDLPPWFEERAFALGEGDVSGTVLSPDGYHVLKVLFRDDERNPAQIQLAHILVASDPLSELLESRRNLAKIYVRR